MSTWDKFLEHNCGTYGSCDICKNAESALKLQELVKEIIPKEKHTEESSYFICKCKSLVEESEK